MFAASDFFASLEGFPCPSLFAEHLDGVISLRFVWDILCRIQRGYVGQMVQPSIQGTVENGAILQGEDICIGKRSRVMAGAMIVGPTIIGEDVEIRHGAYIRGHVIIGDHAVVGHASEVCRSILLPGAKAPHFNYVGDSILGRDVNLGAGSKLSNLKNDGSEVRMRTDGANLATGLRKFGAILGDGCMLGCNVVSNPGTVMGSNCRIYPNTTVSGYLPPMTIAKLRQHLETVQIKQR